MSPEAPAKVRRIASDDPALHPSWPLLEFLLSIGADEFAVRFIYCGAEGKAACERLAATLASASLGERTRECTVTYASQSNPRPVKVWRFDRRSLEALREIMPGVLSADDTSHAWAEDLCVYRRGELLFGTVTHEQFAFLQVFDAEWSAWKAAAERRAT
jgi:hypothetical protein